MEISYINTIFHPGIIMKFNFRSVTAAALLTFSSVCANASVMTYGSVSHDYGSVDGVNASNTFQSCDTLNATSITVRTRTNNCAPFLDNFDFSSIEHGAITSFSLTLNFAGTGNSFENWAMRPASSGLVGSSRTQSLIKTTAAFSQTFVIDNVSNPDVFNTIVSNNNFYLWFASNGLGQQNFTLNSATLDVKGESVPEPASLALFGIAALGFSAARRRVSTAA